MLLITLCISHAHAAASVTLSGPSTVRAGDYITVSLKVNANESYGVEGEFSYDSDLVTLRSISAKPSGWMADQNGNKFVAYDNNLTNPIEKNTTVITASFRVSSGVATGKKITISVKNIVVAGEAEGLSASYSISISRPLSDDATLKSIEAEGASSVEITEDIYDYDIGEVSFSISELNVTATPNDENAKVEISGKGLAVGKNTVKITVTAENGEDKKEYTLTVIRQQDPNYVPSSNANLSEIILSTGIISPHITDEMSKYIVYVPYETETISISATPKDSKAVGVTSVTDGELTVGENIFEIVCTAEDGTEKTYTITVMRMEEYTGVSSEEAPESSDMPSENPDSSTDTSNISSDDVPVINQQDGENEPVTQWLIYLVLIVGSLLLGISLGAIAIPKRRGNRYR